MHHLHVHRGCWPAGDCTHTARTKVETTGCAAIVLWIDMSTRACSDRAWVQWSCSHFCTKPTCMFTCTFVHQRVKGSGTCGGGGYELWGFFLTPVGEKLVMYGGSWGKLGREKKEFKLLGRGETMLLFTIFSGTWRFRNTGGGSGDDGSDGRDNSGGGSWQHRGEDLLLCAKARVSKATISTRLI